MIAPSGQAKSLESSGLSKKDPFGACSKTLMVTAIWASIERSLIWSAFSYAGLPFWIPACAAGHAP